MEPMPPSIVNRLAKTILRGRKRSSEVQPRLCHGIGFGVTSDDEAAPMAGARASGSLFGTGQPTRRVLCDLRLGHHRSKLM
jgi:hypothetical protein